MSAAAQRKQQQGWFSPVVGPKRYSQTAGKPECLQKSYPENKANSRKMNKKDDNMMETSGVLQKAATISIL